MKRVLAIIVLILSYLLPNITSVIFAYRMYVSSVHPNVFLVLLILLSIGYSVAGFFLSNKIEKSKAGLRYKVISIFAIVIGAMNAINELTTFFPGTELVDMLSNYRIFLAFLILLLVRAPMLFGITQFILYKLNYKKQLRDRQKKL